MHILVLGDKGRSVAVRPTFSAVPAGADLDRVRPGPQLLPLAGCRLGRVMCSIGQGLVGASPACEVCRHREHGASGSLCCCCTVSVRPRSESLPLASAGSRATRFKLSWTSCEPSCRRIRMLVRISRSESFSMSPCLDGWHRMCLPGSTRRQIPIRMLLIELDSLTTWMRDQVVTYTSCLYRGWHGASMLAIEWGANNAAQLEGLHREFWQAKYARLCQNGSSGQPCRLAEGSP